MREALTETGKLGLRLLEDLTSLAAGGSVCAYLELLSSPPRTTSILLEFLVLESLKTYSDSHFLFIQLVMMLIFKKCRVLLDDISFLSILQAIWLRVNILQRTFSLDILE